MRSVSDKIYITKKGKIALEEEIRKLKTVDRPSVIEAIATARSHGDLKENAEYHAAKDRQSFIEGRIADLDDKIARAEVIDPQSIKSDKIMFGATISLVNEDGNQKIYQIVGDPEADIKEGRIALSSPIARALMGKEMGDEVTVQSPKGPVVYNIEKIEYK